MRGGVSEVEARVSVREMVDRRLRERLRFEERTNGDD